MARFGFYCLCGASWTGLVEEMDADDADPVVIGSAFRRRHKGEGHGPTTAATARSIRRRWPKQPEDNEFGALFEGVARDMDAVAHALGTSEGE